MVICIPLRKYTLLNFYINVCLYLKYQKLSILCIYKKKKNFNINYIISMYYVKWQYRYSNYIAFNSFRVHEMICIKAVYKCCYSCIY